MGLQEGVSEREDGPLWYVVHSLRTGGKQRTFQLVMPICLISRTQSRSLGKAKLGDIMPVCSAHSDMRNPCTCMTHSAPHDLETPLFSSLKGD